MQNRQAQITFEGNSADFLIELAKMFQEGEFVPQDHEIARIIYEKVSSCSESPEALNSIGWMYENGLGIDKDLTRAEECYKKSAKLGNSLAMLNLGNLYIDVKDDSSKKELVEARNWILKSALLSDDTDTRNKALDNYARCLYEGIGGEKDYDTAFLLFSKVAEVFPDANLYLGLCYQNGYGVEKSAAGALKCYKKGAESGDGYCCINAGVLYESGDLAVFVGMECVSVPNYCTAAKYYLDGINLGDTLGYACIGHLYQSGYLTGKKDEETAAQWFRLGQNHDDKRSIEELSKIPSGIREIIENVDEDEVIESLEKDLITTAKFDKERLDKVYKEQNKKHKSLLRKLNKEA